MNELREKFIHLLENQSLLEAKLLLKKIEEIPDLTAIISNQWLQLRTNVNYENASRIIAFVQSERTVGLGPVLLIQVKIQLGTKVAEKKDKTENVQLNK